VPRNQAQAHAQFVPNSADYGMTIQQVQNSAPPGRVRRFEQEL
jgi:hypothetical protein